MQLVVHPDAQTEIIEAADWYDQRATGLGDEFMADIDSALDIIVERPNVWPVWPGAGSLVPPIQRYLLTRFHRYGVAYQHFDDRVVALAVVHSSRRPFYWLKRADG